MGLCSIQFLFVSHQFTSEVASWHGTYARVVASQCDAGKEKLPFRRQTPGLSGVRENKRQRGRQTHFDNNDNKNNSKTRCQAGPQLSVRPWTINHIYWSSHIYNHLIFMCAGNSPLSFIRFPFKSFSESLHSCSPLNLMNEHVILILFQNTKCSL